MNTTGVTAPDAKVDIIERGHGSRNSLHSALLADSYFPPNIDILLWELAINDMTNGIRDKNLKRIEEKNQLIVWLEQVSKIKPRPSLVVLAYLWNTPFQIGNGKVPNDVFISHQRVAAEYEFVVGHVNLASYVEELQWGKESSQKFLLAVQHHPSRMGHTVLAHLLLDLVIDEERQVTDANITTQKTPYQWACGTESTGKRLIKNRVQGKRPVASFTVRLQHHPGSQCCSSGCSYKYFHRTCRSHQKHACRRGTHQGRSSSESNDGHGRCHAIGFGAFQCPSSSCGSSSFHHTC
jgi:hypothetical protein